MQQIQLTLTLEKKNYNLSSEKLASYLHGVLMEVISTEYAAFLHQQSFNPYSSHVFKTKRNFIWQINLLTEESIEQIGDVLLKSSFKSFKLRSLNDANVNIIEKAMTQRTEKDLADIFYHKYPPKRLKIQFDSGTSFKQAGKNIFYPDLTLIFQSILLRYHHFFEDGEIDKQTLEEIVEAMEITSYNLQSTYYPIHKVRIPAFRGEIRIRLNTNDTLKNYILMLLKFAEYSGVGVKTSLGMGSIRVSKI